MQPTNKDAVQEVAKKLRQEVKQISKQEAEHFARALMKFIFDEKK